MESEINEMSNETITIPELTVGAYSHTPNEALTYVKNMRLGWNLGNTFDAVDSELITNELDYEKLWSGSITSKKMIDDIKLAGFNTIRIPVSWHNHIDEVTLEISSVWLGRVEEVVNYALDNKMYVIINIHHDNSKAYIYPTKEFKNQSIRYVKAIWQQIANHFIHYDDHLIFETLNEPRMIGHKYEWWFDTRDVQCLEAIDVVNKLNQVAVNTIRSTGTNNAERYLMIPGYVASPEGALTELFQLPLDTTDNKLIVSAHAYTPFNYALQPIGENGSTDRFNPYNHKDIQPISDFIEALYRKYIINGIPVVMGEFGARDKNNLQERVNYATYYTAKAKAHGITCIWWDNAAITGDSDLFGIYDRTKGQWAHMKIVDGLTAYLD